MKSIGQKRGLIILVLGAVAAVALLFLMSWERKKESYPLKEEKEVPLSEAQGMNLVGWNEKGGKSWELEADSGAQFPERMVLNRVNLRFLEKGEPVSGVETKQLTIDSRSNNLLFKGDVKITSYLDGAELFASELEWVASERKLRTEDKVTIKRKNFVVEGWGFVAAPDLSQVEIKREVTTRFLEEDE